MELMPNDRLDQFIEYQRLQHTGNERASRRQRDRIAAQNDRLALSVARRMQLSCKEDFEDLSKHARIGL